MNYTLFAILILFQLGWSTFVKSEGGTGPRGYTAHDGPAKWEDQCQNAITSFATAKQSPIDIVDRSLFRLPSQACVDASKAHPNACNLVAVNDGHTVQFSAHPGDETSRLPVVLKRDNTTYHLAQFHFHTPSEHLIGSTHSDAEMHLVFLSKEGKGAVVGLLFNVDSTPKTPHLWPLFAKGLPKEKDGIVHSPTVDLFGFFKQLGNKLEDTYQYDGSLTTPGCDEGIKWHVNQKIFPMSVRDFLLLRSTIKFSARPVQPRHDGAGGVANKKAYVSSCHGNSKSRHHKSGLHMP